MVRWVGVLVSSALLGSAAWGDEVGGTSVGVPAGSKPVVERLLDIMLAQGAISRSEHDEMLAQARAEQEAAAAAVASAAAAAARETPPVGEGPKDWSFKWGNGFKLQRNDGMVKLKFGGRIHADGTFIWQSDNLNSAIGGDGNGAELRRARIFTSGTLYDRVFFKAAYDFADNEVNFKDVYIGLKDLGPIGNISVGQFKEPFYLEEWTSSKYIVFMERGATNAFYPGRNLGAMAMGNALEDRVYWQLGVFRQTDGDAGTVFDDWDDVDWNVTGRLVGVPIYSEEGGKVLHVGATYSHQFLNGSPETLRYRQRPPSHQAQRYVDTRDPSGLDIPAKAVNLLNAELSGVWGRFHAQSEYTNSWVEGDGAQDNLHFWGIYAQAGFFLTGEHRVYDFGNGRFTRVKPRASFNPAKGDWGAWEIAARFGYVDLENENIKGGKLWDVTAGINWWLYPNVRFMWNYIHADVQDRNATTVFTDLDGRGDIFQMRFMMDF